MRFLLLGRSGQVGWEQQRSLAPLGEVIALDRNSVPPGGGSGDLADLGGLRAAVRGLRLDVIVNAAAFTAVDRAESEPDLARSINAVAPGVLVEAAQAAGAWLVHYSTDYMFRRQRLRAQGGRRRNRATECLRIDQAGGRTVDCRRLRGTFNLVLPPWQQGVRRMLTEILNPEAD